jgi:NTP pyrophosphatase (non-canonical NTP hydrolase)
MAEKNKANTGNREMDKLLAPLTADNREKLFNATANIKENLARGSKFALAADLTTVRTILAPDPKAHKSVKQAWSTWIKVNKFEGLPKATAYRLMDAYQEAQKVFSPVFLAALAASGVALNITPSVKKPLGKYTDVALKYAEEINPKAKLTEEKAAELVLAVVRDKPEPKPKKSFLVQKIELAENVLDKLNAIKKKELGLSGDDSPSPEEIREELTDVINHLLFLADFEEDECEFSPTELVSSKPAESSEPEKEEGESEPVSEAKKEGLSPQVISEAAKEHAKKQAPIKKTA